MIAALVERKLRGLNVRWSPTVFKAVLVSLVAGALVVPIALVALPFIEFFNGMAAQPKGKAQMTYGRTFDPAGFGWTVERDPVPGTLPRGVELYAFSHIGIGPKDAELVGQQLESPLAVSIEQMQQGQKLYGIYCQTCHGKRGRGDGPVVGPNRFPAPPSLHSDKARLLADGAIFHIVTKGTKIMPGYADKLDATERWQVIQYLRALQRAEQPRPEDFNQ